MVDAKIVQPTDKQGNELAPQTLMSWAIKQDGQLLENSILPKKGSSIPHWPAEDYNPATKDYVDTKQKVKIIISVEEPASKNVATFGIKSLQRLKRKE